MDTVDVLVVGAGPVGLTVAHELRRRGVGVRVVDRADGPAPTSRATATHARTLEVYHQMGVLEELLARGQRVGHFSMHRGGRMLARLGTDYSELPTRFPFTLQIDQVFTEEVLRKRLSELGTDVEWSCEVTGLGQDARGVTVDLSRDGGTEKLAVPWLVGADGAHSFVRRSLGLKLLGDSTETWLVADAMIDLDLPRDSLHWLHTGNGTVLLVPFATPGKWRLLDTADVDNAGDYAAVGARFAGKLRLALGKPVEVSTPTWVSAFTIQQRMIPSMRSGRCFVAGDAAHVHSPASGQGMNTGIQDAHNLGWKLAQVVRGEAEESLLDSYGVERVPVGEVLLGSTKTATALIALRNFGAPVLLPVGLGILKRVTPLRRRIERKILRGMSGLALHYRESPLSQGVKEADGLQAGDRVGCSAETEQASPGWRALCAELADPRWTLLAFPGTEAGFKDTLAEIDEHFSGAVSVRTVSTVDSFPHRLTDPGDLLRGGLDAREGDFLLIRPDGYLAARGTLAGTDLTSVLSDVHLRPKASR
ncbi:FAD-dependent oxidoreductase [Amycolatopsis sp. NPDC089917]|uniref:FAD-dependent oxidoreductase n=1 Tax=Amycolatopsis sp. NPDC089917 TaxID=3155187 RepID=UPI003431D563